MDANELKRPDFEAALLSDAAMLGRNPSLLRNGDGTYAQNLLNAAWWGYCATLPSDAAQAPRDDEGWISVDDDQPQPETDVLVKKEFGSAIYYDIAGLFDGEWQSQVTESAVKHRVTHWKPIDAAPVAPAAAAPITRDAFYQALRAALKQHRRANPPRYLNDEQADASDDDFASAMADHHAQGAAQ